MTRSDLFCPHGNPACGDPGSPYMARCELCDPPTDDIVDRLYRYALQYNPVLEAADTISRLREAGDRLAYWALQEHLAGELISAAKAWKEARRG